jgi:HAD superfamily phosphoserine phosphatase-like hydrolase
MDYFNNNRLRRAPSAFYWAYHTPSYFLFKFGLITQSRFRRGWANHLAWFFRAFREVDTQRVWDSVVNEFLPNNLRQDSLELLDAHKQSGDLIVLVSGVPTPLVQRIAEHLGADYGMGTDLLINDGLYTGKSGDVCQDQNKVLLTKRMLL